jgi:hypothetical protein
VQQDGGFTFDSTNKILALSKSMAAYGNSTKMLTVTDTGINNSFSSELFARSGYNEIRFNTGGLGNGTNVEQTFMTVIGSNTSALNSLGNGSVGFQKPVTINYAAATTPAAMLDVKAQGSLSTDIALRVRNSADTADIFIVQGDAVTVAKTRMTCGVSGMTNTGGALHVYAGNSSDYVSRWFNTAGIEIMNVRTNGNGGTLALNNASGTAGISLNGIFSNALTFGAGKDIYFDTATGTKIGAATNQKLAFWNKTPIVQPTTAITGATFVSNGGTGLTSTDTFDGYTLAKVVRALVNVGILA